MEVTPHQAVLNKRTCKQPCCAFYLEDNDNKNLKHSFAWFKSQCSAFALQDCIAFFSLSLSLSLSLSQTEFCLKIQETI